MMATPLKTFVLAVAIAFCAYAATVQADETWTCATQGSGENAVPSMHRYTIAGDLLVTDDQWEEFFNDAPYRLLENNQYGLIAVAASASKHEKKVSVGEAAVLIDKTTGKSLWIWAFMDRPLDAVRGTCVHN